MYGSRRQKISIQPTQKVTGNSRGSQKLKLLKPGEYIILYEAKLGFPEGGWRGRGGGGWEKVANQKAYHVYVYNWMDGVMDKNNA